ncbi:DUF397 domain-containing protein [Streptomyces sp. NPDC059752]|uniref:DUF397 domain-containing protein n=1 Tax=unclassified Streptomyces TaxID=2593676 RepID=UPI00366865FD
MSPIDTLTWIKSSHSSGDGDQCVEVAVAWRKSSYSGGDGDACIEIATRADTVHVRDSKVTDGPVLDLAPASWAQLTGWVSE